MALIKRKMDNAAAGTLPTPARPVVQPGPTTIHHNGPNWVGIVVVGFLCLLALGPVLWMALVYLMGFIAREPDYWAAALVVFTPLTLIFLWFGSWLAGPHLDRHYGHLDYVEEQKTKREEIRLLAAQTTVDPSRYTESDYQFARVVLSVMESAYMWLEDKQLKEFPARWRPWSKSSTLETAERIGISITHDKALSVAKWLADEGIITAADGGQIGKDYPNLSNIKAHLDRKYGRPIRNVPLPVRNNEGFLFTK